jgi:hypothetical protein
MEAPVLLLAKKVKQCHTFIFELTSFQMEILYCFECWITSISGAVPLPDFPIM